MEHKLTDSLNNLTYDETLTALLAMVGEQVDVHVFDAR